MATTSPDNIRTPDAGDQYALVQDLGALADTTQVALNRRSRSCSGTFTVQTQAGGAIASRSITYPVGVFRTTPVVLLNATNPLGHQAGIQYRVSSRTLTGFTVECRSFPVGTTAYSIDLSWVAME